jgi:hypothetical protein
MHTLPPLEHIRRDLTAHLYGFAHIADRCVRPGSGSSILNLAPTGANLDFPKYDDFELSSFPLAEGLGSVYRYAAFGETSPNDDHLSLDPNEGALGRMQLLQTFVSNPAVSYCFDEVTQSFDEPNAPRGGFPEMVALAGARATLDEGLDLTPGQVALLANVSERTVANAMAMKGDSRLAASRDAEGRTVVTAAEADRWLGGRRAFLKSVSVRSGETMPDVMNGQELATFITTRIHEEVPDDGLDFSAMKSGEVRSIPGQRLATICRVLGWSEQRAQAWLGGNVDALDLDDCRAAADMILHVDAQWLTRQLMNVRFPDVESELEATLTEAGIRSGYFDIEQRFARRFFPDDSFGGRGTDELGVPVLLHVDGKSHETDIRVKSQALVSPRKRFTGYFKSHGAKPGDRVLITRFGEREFKLVFISK